MTLSVGLGTMNEDGADQVIDLILLLPPLGGYGFYIVFFLML